MGGWINGAHCYKHIDKKAGGGYSLVFAGQDVPVTPSFSRLLWGLRQAAWCFHCMHMKIVCLAMF